MTSLKEVLRDELQGSSVSRQKFGGKHGFQSIKSAPTGEKEKTVVSLAPLFPVKHGVSQLMM